MAEGHSDQSKMGDTTITDVMQMKATVRCKLSLHVNVIRKGKVTEYKGGIMKVAVVIADNTEAIRMMIIDQKLAQMCQEQKGLIIGDFIVMPEFLIATRLTEMFVSTKLDLVEEVLMKANKLVRRIMTVSYTTISPKSKNVKSVEGVVVKKNEVDKSKYSEARIEKDVEIEDLKRGDHIGVINAMGKVEYQHHGIYLGHQTEVAHFGGDSIKNAKIEVVSLKKFCFNLTRLIRFVYAEGDCYDDEEVAKNAESWVEHPDGWTSYYLLRYNFENFATVCKTGKKTSRQVWEKFMALLDKPLQLKKYDQACSSSPRSKPTIEKHVELKDLERGDHIGIENYVGDTKFDYQHHGIFVGNCSVAHFGGIDKMQAKLEIVDLTKFGDLSRLIRFKYADDDCYDNEIVARTAEEYVEHPDKWSKYRVFSNNCEHFASVCKTGEKRSRQVWEKFKKLLEKPSRLKKYASAGSCISGVGSHSFVDQKKYE